MTPALKDSLRYAAPAALATALALGRWLWQGTGNVYSKLDLKLYLVDPDLGWRRTEAGYTWLGLDLIAVLVAVTIGVFLVLRFAGSRQHRAAKALALAAKLASVLVIAVPLYALLGGAPPSGARDTLPSSSIAAPTNGIEASLTALPPGRYLVVPHPDAAITAKLNAGGETFDARFAGGLTGYWEATPGDLGLPMSAQISVQAGSIDTGIALRDEHAKEDLKPATFPTIDFSLGDLTSTESSERGVAFAASGALTLGGRVHVAPVVGTLRPVDETLRTKLGLEGGIFVLLQASLELNIRETIVGNDGTFDVDTVPIAVTLILEHSEKLP